MVSVLSEKSHENIILNDKHYSYVGFFKHEKDHDIAYEFFTNQVLWLFYQHPLITKNLHLFILQKKNKYNTIKKLIFNKVVKSHGKLIFDKSLSKFPITPHLQKTTVDLFILVIVLSLYTQLQGKVGIWVLKISKHYVIY